MSSGVVSRPTVTRSARRTPTSEASLSENSDRGVEPTELLGKDQPSSCDAWRMCATSSTVNSGNLVLGLDTAHPDDGLRDALHRRSAAEAPAS